MVLLMTDRLPRGGSAAARGAEGLSRQPGARSRSAGAASGAAVCPHCCCCCGIYRHARVVRVVAAPRRKTLPTTRANPVAAATPPWDPPRGSRAGGRRRPIGGPGAVAAIMEQGLLSAEQRNQHQAGQPVPGTPAWQEYRGPTPMVWSEAMDRQPTVLPTATPSCGPNIVAGAIIQIAFIVSAVVLFEEVKAWTHSVVRKPDGTLTSDPEADKRVHEAFGIASTVLVVFVGELFCCASARYLRNIKQDVGAYAHVDNVRRSAPVIRWVMQCWHWERETYHKTETDDSTGNTREVEKHRTVRKDTWLFRGAYSPYYWEDISSPFPNFGDAHMTRLRFRKRFVFADQQSAYDYQQELRDFIRQRHMDVHYDFKESLDIGGYRSHVLACKQVGTIPWWIGQCYYYLASILCCSVPYHLLCYHDPNCLSEQSEICLYLALPSVRLIMYVFNVSCGQVPHQIRSAML
jgi:hypothetical protein